MNRLEYIWPEEQFREDDFIVFRVRSLSYPYSIAFIKISPNDYTAYNGDYSLKDGEIIAIHKLANSLMDNYFPYSS
ncbi:hypothetical protein A11Q_2461 [Pseudobdellovibrio exovorus JSS]|uniref:Uncharacterized protein n=1 Tax=Pseudobdellovibrio exovorus JSS TaxID=1184267 RepID=M4VBA6_9BACT|nr:hypothetical protein A11Q_2461 [Pseudobdellovibrio exovorus JSS]